MFKKNSGVVGFPFALVARADGSAVTTGTATAYVTKDGGIQATVAAAPVHEGNGQWTVDLTAGEMNGDVVGLLVTHASAIPVHFAIRTTTKLVSELADAPAITPPANFSALAITAAGKVTVGTNDDKAGYTATTVSDKTGYSLAQAFPANFADLTITATTGRVTAGTVSDKAGYSLAQAFPANFASLGINASGHVSRVTLVDTTTTNADVGAAGAALTALGDARLANLDAAVTSRLAPTVAGRTLDVSLGGEAGVDWANVGSPTTAVALSGTTVGTATTLTNKSGFSLAVAPPTAAAVLAEIKADAGFVTLLDVGTALDLMIVDDGGGAYEYTTGALANAPTGGSAPTVAQIRQEMDSGSTQLAAIKAKTDNLPASPAAVGSNMGAVASVTGNVGGNVVGSVASVTAAVTVGTIAASASNVKKSTALAGFMFVMTDATTHAPKPGVAVVATRSLDGAAFAACANGPSEVSGGAYAIDLAATDLAGNVVTLRFVGTDADDLLMTVITQP